MGAPAEKITAVPRKSQISFPEPRREPVNTKEFFENNLLEGHSKAWLKRIFEFRNEMYEVGRCCNIKNDMVYFVLKNGDACKMSVDSDRVKSLFTFDKAVGDALEVLQTTELWAHALRESNKFCNTVSLFMVKVVECGHALPPNFVDMSGEQQYDVLFEMLEDGDTN